MRQLSTRNRNDIIHPMERDDDLIWRIILPTVLIVLLGIAPRPAAVEQALAAARQAHAQNHFQEASRQIALAAQHTPWRADLWLLAGQYALQGGDAQAALRLLQQSPVVDELLLGDAYRQSGDLASAITHWEAALAAPQGKAIPAEIYPRLLEAHRAGGDLAAAIADLQALWSLQPANAWVNYQLGLLLAATQPEIALPYLDRAGELNAPLAAGAQGLRKTLQTAQGGEPAYNLLAAGRALGAMNEWELAAAALRQAVALRPDYAEAWAYLGEARQRLGEDGRADLQRALSLDSTSVAINTLAALYWQRQGDQNQAFAYLDAAAKLDPRNPVLHAEIARALAATGDLPAAEEAYRQAIRLAPGDSTYWRFMAEFALYYQIQIRELALPAARQAVWLAPADSANLAVMAHALLQLGDTFTAERYLRQALEIAPHDALLHLRLGQMYLLRGALTEARQEFDLTQALAPNTPLANQAQRFLEAHWASP